MRLTRAPFHVCWIACSSSPVTLHMHHGNTEFEPCEPDTNPRGWCRAKKNGSCPATISHPNLSGLGQYSHIHLSVTVLTVCTCVSSFTRNALSLAQTW